MDKNSFLIKNCLICAVLILSVFFGPNVIHAFEGGVFDFDKELPVEITGDSVDYDDVKKTYRARGSVVMVQAGTTLKADEVTVDMLGGIASAQGNVEVIDKDGNFLKGSSLEIEMDKETAVVLKGRLFFKETNLHISGAAIRKTGEKSYSSQGSTFTTCDCEEGATPSWHFYSDEANLTIDGYLFAWNTFFYLHGLPVLYSPLVGLPVKRERQSGFLTPAIGYSRLRGLKFDNSFFWAISNEKDATFYLDMESKRGLGKGGEFRYYRTRKSFGELYLYHFRERDMDRVREFRADADNLLRPLSADNDRYQLKLKHREVFSNDIALKIDVHVVSDDEYFIDFAKTGKERALESIESTLSVSKGWGRYNLTGQARFFDNLLVKDDSGVLQIAPEIVFTATSQRVGESPLFTSLTSAFVSFKRDVGVRGERFDIRPRLALPLTMRNGFEITPSITPRWTFYRVENDPLEENRQRKRYLYEFSTDITSTFIRYFDSSLLTFDRFRHTLRPKLSYVYIPEVRQDNLPSYDDVDRIAAANEIRYSINTTLGGRIKEGGVKDDLFYMDLSQTYDIREARGDERIDPERKRPFSDIQGEGIFRPSEFLSMSVRGRYDVYDGWFESSDGTLSLRNHRGDFLAVTHRFLREGSIRYLSVDAGFKITESLRAGISQRYSLRDDEPIERNYSMGYARQCWGVELRYSERVEESIVVLTFALKGIGEVLSTGGEFKR